MPWTRLQFPYLLLNREARLFIGTGAYGRLPVMKEVEQEAERREVELVILPTAKAIEALSKNAKGTSAILHVTC